MTWKTLATSALGVSLLVGTVSCAAPQARFAPFRVRPDSVDRGDLHGPFDGRVLDGETDRPVAGALVYATWTYVEGEGLTVPAGFHEHLDRTDANGTYHIPRLADPPRRQGRRIGEFFLIIYKKGYIGYRSDRRFDDLLPRTDFAQHLNVIRLERWRSDLSPVQHLRYLGGGGQLAPLVDWEHAEAAAELSGKKAAGTATTVTTPGGAGEVATAAAVPDARKLLQPDDVKQLTKWTGNFQVVELGDQPITAAYSNVHLRAVDQPETFDVALRVWRLAPEAAQRQYGQLLGELPGVEERNELGDRSLRATSDAKDILAIAWLDSQRGVVTLLTCGSAQCTAPEPLLELARLVRSRIDAALGGEQ